MTTDIEKTITDLERQRGAIDRAISALREITGFAPNTAERAPAALKKEANRGISPEGKARIAEAQRKRWAAKRKAEATLASEAASSREKQSRGKKAAKKKAAKKKAAAKAAGPEPTKVAAATAP